MSQQPLFEQLLADPTLDSAYEWHAESTENDQRREESTMRPNLFKHLRLAAGLLMLGVGGEAHSAILFTATEVGSDVVINASGSFDLTGMTYIASGNSPIGAFLNPSLGRVRLGTGFMDYYSGLTGPANFGIGGQVNSPNTTVAGAGVYSGIGYLFVPQGYTSGNLLSASGTWSGQSFASLGMTVGSYTWSAANGDTVTLDVGIAPAAAVPEVGAALPINLALMAIGAIAVRRRLRG